MEEGRNLTDESWKGEGDGTDVEGLCDGIVPALNVGELREAHAKLDDIVESCYPGYPFASDEARQECLFKLYEKMTVKK